MNAVNVKAIAIETSGQTGSVAAIDCGVVADERTFSHGLRHAAGLIPLIDSLSSDRGWSPSDVEHLYVSAGPGSFTGLRIGITLAKAFALATGVRIVAVPSVRVLAENAPPDATELIVALDAKRGQVFAARFSRSSPADAWTESEPVHLGILAQILARAARPVWVLGEGIPYHRDALPDSDPDIHIVDPAAWSARASAVAKIGMRMADRGEFADPLRLTPIYIRLPEAQEKWDALHRPG